MTAKCITNKADHIGDIHSGLKKHHQGGNDMMGKAGTKKQERAPAEFGDLSTRPLKGDASIVDKGTTVVSSGGFWTPSAAKTEGSYLIHAMRATSG